MPEEMPQQTQNMTAVSRHVGEAEPETTEAEQEALELATGDFAAAMATDNITMKAIKDYFQKQRGKRPGEGIFLLIGDKIQRCGI